MSTPAMTTVSSSDGLAASRSAIRDPSANHLITEQNSALILIDYQPSRVAAVRSMGQDLLVKNGGFASRHQLQKWSPRMVRRYGALR